MRAPVVPSPSGSLTDVEPAKGAHQRYALFMLTLVLALNMADRNFLLIVLEPIKTEFRLSDSQVGMLSGMTFGLTYAAASIPLGLLVDRVNRSRLLAAVLFIWSGATALAATAQGFASLLLTRLVVGASEAGGSPASLSLIADYFESKHRPAAISIYNMGTPLGASAALALGGMVVAEWGWRAGFLMAGLPGLIVAALVLMTLRDPRKAVARSAARGAAADVAAGLLAALRAILTGRCLLLMAGGITMMSTASAGVTNWVVPFLMREHGLPVAQAGFAMAGCYGLGALGLAAAGLFTHRIRDHDPRYGLYFTMAVALISVAGTSLFLLAPDCPLSLAGLIILGSLGYTYIGASLAIVINVSPERERGSVLAILQIFTNLFGYGVGTMLVGVFSDFYGGPSSLRWAIFSLMPLYGVAILLFFWVSFHVRADMTAAGARRDALQSLEAAR
jgi:predicted MFS family arabinose efflux permease